MALQKKYSDAATGLELPNAYHRVNGILIDYVAKQVTFAVLVYRDAAARQQGLNPIGQGAFAVQNLPATETIDGQPHAEFDEFFGDAVFAGGKTDPRRQAYEWLKRTKAVRFVPFYTSGAVDVLEKGQSREGG